MAEYGVDISSFQRGFAFDKYGGSWLGLKQTEGLTWPDRDDPESAELLRDYRLSAASHGKTSILYHFLRPQSGRTGRDEADHFIQFVGDLGSTEGIMIDDEWDHSPMRGDEHEDFVVAFIDRVEEQWPEMQRKVLYYSYPAYMATVSTDRIAQRCPLWVAYYGPNNGLAEHGPPPLDRWSSAAIWQYSSEGRDPAYDGPIDVNVLYVPIDSVTRAYAPESASAQADVRFSSNAISSSVGEHLRRGSHGARVVRLQRMLATRGWSIRIDGEFGRETDSVVRAFQEQESVPADGVVRNDMWSFLTEPTPFQKFVVERARPAHPDPVEQILAWQFYDVSGFQVSFAWWDLVVDGDPGPETAKAVQKVADEAGHLSPHFSISELRCKHCGRIRAHRETLRSLERERELLGHPIVIVSGHRCEEHNRNVGGAPNSQHLYGTAADKRTPVWSSEAAGFSGIGTCGDECLHGDRRDAGPNNTTGGQPHRPTYWSYC